jgi:hypothetical protein
MEHEGVVELRHGLGAFISKPVEERAKLMRKAQVIAQSAVERLRALGATEEEIRRLFERELSAMQAEQLEGRMSSSKPAGFGNSSTGIRPSTDSI